MQLTLRTANPTDAKRVAEVFLASRETLFPYAPLTLSNNELEQWIGNILIPRGNVTLALYVDEIVGMIAVSDNEDFTWIDQLYVHPHHVGHGAGAALLQSVIACVSNPIRLYTFQQNEPARVLYERYGFVAIAFSDGSNNEEKCPDVLYERCGKT